MRQQPVWSTNLESIGCDPTPLTIEIVSHSGFYHYLGVPRDVHEKLLRGIGNPRSLRALVIKGRYTPWQAA